MYARYRNYYRNRFGYYADEDVQLDQQSERSSRRRARALWRYNRPRPRFEADYWELILDDIIDSDDEKPDEKPAEPKPEDPKPEDPKPEGDKPKPKRLPKFNVLDVNLNVAANRVLHHTDDYEKEGLIVRRGQAFTMEVTVDRRFQLGEDVIKLQFALGLTPMESKGTMFIIRGRKNPDKELPTDEPGAKILSVEDEGEGSKIKLHVYLPPDCVVGRFTVNLRLRNKEEEGGKGGFSRHRLEEEIIVLFNPWCKDDLVYMEDDAQRKEYVLEDSGVIFIGNSHRPRPRNWNFGQFEKASLDAALYIMDSSNMPYEAYGNPVRVSRNISAMVNSNSGDNGILTGNWSGNYEGGTKPTAWAGSVKILEQYMETKQPVDYGQCWVFSGLTTTICRALGIPARSVTNFDSAHDTDESMTIDYHVNADGDALKHMNDSVWNFHVWNEGWFKRPDLPDGNDGWQAFDGTPQELSDSVMCCGPSPLKAIKEGNVHVGYDTKFILGEVNGDKVTWEVYDSTGERRVIKVDKASVGAKISTKAVGSNDRDDVTDQYKYTEGSEKERSVMNKVIQMSTRRKGLEAFYKLDQKHDVDITFSGEISSQGDAQFKFSLKNTASENRSVNGRFHVMAKYYTGVEGDEVADTKKTFNLEPGKEEKFEWTLKAADWINKIDEDATLAAYVTAKVVETGQNFISEQSFEMDKPELRMTVSKDVVKRLEEVEVTISFTNPLEVPLTKVEIEVEGAGIKRVKTIKLSGEIAPKADITEKVTVVPKMLGNRNVVATLNSRQLVNIFGSVGLAIEKPE